VKHRVIQFDCAVLIIDTHKKSRDLSSAEAISGAFANVNLRGAHS
jgi:hypothetical protein